MVAVAEPAPMDALPSKNSKAPGVLAGVTVAVRTTGVPASWGLAGEAARVVVVVAAAGALMVNGAAPEVDGANAAMSVGVNTAV